MASVTIRQVPDDVVERIKDAARARGVSMEQELPDRLAEAYPDRAARCRDLAALLDRWAEEADEPTFDPSRIERVHLPVPATTSKKRRRR